MLPNYFQIKNRWLWLSLILIIFSYLLLTGANIYFGDLNQDEGWYLYAAGQVHDGALPYRDFAFTQAPLMPFTYAVFWPIIEKYGLLMGRLLTAAFGLISALLCAWLAARLAPKDTGKISAILTFILIGLNVYHSYFTTVVKTYSLCSVFLAAGLLILTWRNSKNVWIPCFLSGLFLACAAGVRISAGISLPIVGLYLLFGSKSERWRFTIPFGLGGGLGLLALGLPFILKCPEGFMFGVFQYHTGRIMGSLTQLMMLKIGFLSRFVQGNYVAVCLALAIGLIKVDKIKSKHTILLWLIFFGITLVHFTAPFPYDDYQVIVYPIFAVAVAVGLIRRLPLVSLNTLLIFVLFVVLASSFSSPINQAWMIRGRELIWWRVKDQPDLMKLRESAKWIADRSDPDDILLTQDTYLAVEAGMKVPSGMELGPFCYYPDMSRERAELLHVLNRELMEETLQNTQAELAAFSEYGLAIRSPEIIEAESEIFHNILSNRYVELRKVAYFGQAHTTLRLLSRKETK